MNDRNAKMQVLEQLMAMMDQSRMGGLKKKGAPAEPAMPPAADPAAEMELGDSVAPDAAAAPGDEMDPEMLQKLMEMYSSKDDDETPPAM